MFYVSRVVVNNKFEIKPDHVRQLLIFRYLPDTILAYYQYNLLNCIGS